jgi:hypothetical protein
VKLPGVKLAVAPSDRQRCDQPLHVAHSRFHQAGTLIEESRGRDLVWERPTGRSGLAWSTVGEVCPETPRPARRYEDARYLLAILTHTALAENEDYDISELVRLSGNVIRPPIMMMARLLRWCQTCNMSGCPARRDSTPRRWTNSRRAAGLESGTLAVTGGWRCHAWLGGLVRTGLHRSPTGGDRGAGRLPPRRSNSCANGSPSHLPPRPPS